MLDVRLIVVVCDPDPNFFAELSDSGRLRVTTSPPSSEIVKTKPTQTRRIAITTTNIFGTNRIFFVQRRTLKFELLNSNLFSGNL